MQQRVENPEVPVPTQESQLSTLLRDFRTHPRARRGQLGVTFKVALEAVWDNRTRSLLTTLGVVIGIAAVVGSLTLTQGVSTYISSFIAGRGANTIFVEPGSPTNPGTATRQVPQTLTDTDYLSLRQLPHVVAASPRGDVGLTPAIYGNQNWNTKVVGVSPDLQTIQSWLVADGFWFNETQNAEGATVAVIGDTVALKLFSVTGTNPVGKQIRIRNDIFRVVGVLAPKGGNQDDIIYIPYKAAEARLTNQSVFGEIDIEVDNTSNIDPVLQEIKANLESRHHIQQGHPDDFQMRTSIQILQQDNQITQTMALLIAGIAAISLTVGGIGIMNIMLVSVTERTREIGIRIALGARRREILSQFLFEALIVCLLGGVIGLLIGLLIGWVLVGFIISALVGGSNVAFIVTPTILILPFVVSLSVSIIFGLYPAIQAARLDPVVALQYSK